MERPKNRHHSTEFKEQTKTPVFDQAHLDKAQIYGVDLID